MPAQLQHYDMSAPTKALSIKKTTGSIVTPFLFTSQEFVGKMIDRGYNVNVEMRNRLYIIASENSGVGMSPLFWKECTSLDAACSGENAAKVQEIRRLLILFSMLEKYKINYVNIVVLFASMTAQQRKNLCRHYYLEWMKRKGQPSHDGRGEDTDDIQWLHTPRDFSRLESDSFDAAWYHMIEQFLGKDNLACSVFFINQFYTYMTPFI